MNLGVLVTGAYWVITGHWSLGSLFAFQGYLGRVFGPVQFLATANLGLQNARASLERVSALFDLVPEEKTGKGLKKDRLQGDIEFRNVSFSYDAHNPVLENISFRVRSGERVAIVGPSGVGKTTLVSLILRFYRPTSGDYISTGYPRGILTSQLCEGASATSRKVHCSCQGPSWKIYAMEPGGNE